MNIRNHKISERQCFRVCLLENIAIPMLVIPYITMRFSGAFHTVTFVIGLCLYLVYAYIMMRFAKWMPQGMISYVSRYKAPIRNSISVLYVFRYVLRCAIIILYFSRVTHSYMLRSVPPVMIAIPFVFICAYGALSDIEKRGRLMELLFWWMIMPLIFIAVFVVSNANLVSIHKELVDAVAMQQQDIKLSDVLKCAYYVMLVASSVELMMYTIVAVQKHRVYNVRRIIVWTIFAFTFAYVFIFGVLGEEWVGKNNMAAFNVMEAAAVPFGLVQRMDYAVLAFWIIGVFAMVSGYMFYAKQYGSNCFADGRKPKEGMLICGIGVFIMLVIFGLTNEWIFRVLTTYLIYFDIVISLLIPIVLNKGMSHKKTATVLGMLCLFGVLLSGCGKRYESKSVEKRDYAKTMSIELGEDATRFLFTFQVMNLEEYSGNGTGKLQTDTFCCVAESIEAAIAAYYDEKGQQLDLGHMEEIVLGTKPIREDAREDAREGYMGFAAIVEEFSTMPFVPKSIPVYERGSDDRTTLREQIRTLFSLKQK